MTLTMRCMAYMYSCVLMMNMYIPSVLAQAPSTQNHQYAQPQMAKSKSTPSLKVRGSISRASFNRVYTQGLQSIIASIRVKPARQSGRFVGFEITSITSRSLAARGGFKVGDIILSVNGEPIGKPEQMMRAWSLIQHAPEIIISYERAQLKKHARWLIQ